LTILVSSADIGVRRPVLDGATKEGSTGKAGHGAIVNVLGCRLPTNLTLVHGGQQVDLGMGLHTGRLLLNAHRQGWTSNPVCPVDTHCGNSTEAIKTIGITGC